ncbi:probable 2-ketogluconate reductase [Lethenteron reissneri]|uniref:probable 2-ketogluconate reductase n=1 Tax=Lethenteron reissneri TaxID=7753 RepID=UPI002AB64226|nr:probable 2-ketogluconate reductase [Lethenteron reissneri]
MEQLPYMLVSEYLSTTYNQDEVKCITKYFNVVTLTNIKENKGLAEKVEAIGILCWKLVVTKDLLDSLPNLRTVASAGAGVDHLDLPLLWSHGVSVSHTPDVVSATTADMGMALLLASAREVVNGAYLTKSPNFMDGGHILVGVDVYGAALGILGMGRIGRLVAERARGFHMSILYHNRTRRPIHEETALGAQYCQKIDEVLEKSDFLVIAVDANPGTVKIIGERELKLMKTNATIINISRGIVIDQAALVKALQNKWIRAAALDVTDPEPLPRDHPLLQLPNVIVTPHIGASTVHTRREMLQSVAATALAAVQGRPIPHEVKPHQG